VVGVDEGSGLVVDGASSGEEFFGADGKVSPAFQKVIDFLNELDRSRKTTDAAVSALAPEVAQDISAADGLFANPVHGNPGYLRTTLAATGSTDATALVGVAGLTGQPF